MDCPQCGDETERLYEGYCLECAAENQAELTEHLISFEEWEKLSSSEREKRIKEAVI